MMIQFLTHSTIFSFTTLAIALALQATTYAQIIPDALGTQITPNVNIKGIY